MMLMGLLCWVVLIFLCRKKAIRGQQPALSEAQTTVQPRKAGPTTSHWPLVIAAIAVALLISLLTPLLWTTWRPRFLPWPIESYINGVHNLGAPQPWLFPIFPWSGFAFAGLAVGFTLQSPWTKPREARVFFSVGIVGLALIEVSRWLDALPVELYPVYDYWHTSPNFFLIRIGMLLVILTGAYAWCRWGLALRGFSPLIQLGQASLLVYWVHIEFVYGRFSILTRHAQTIAGATRGLAIIFVSMVALAYIRTHAKAWLKSLQSKPQLGLSC